MHSSQSQSQSRNRGRLYRRAPPHFSQKLLRIIVLTHILAILSISAQVHSSPKPVQASGSPFPVAIIDYAFQPLHINITTGTEIIWTYVSNGKDVHTVTSSPQTNTTQGGSPLLSSGVLEPGQSFNYLFYKHGFYPFQCSVHPNIPSMNGWVNVTGSDIQPPVSNAPLNYPLYVTIGAIVGIAAVISVVAYTELRTRKPKATCPI